MAYLINAVEVTSAFVAFEVLLNGGPLMRVLDEPDGNWMQKGNALLVLGDNEIELSVRPLTGMAQMHAQASIALKIYEGPYGGHPGDAGLIDEARWSQGASPIGGTDFQTVHKKSITSSAATGGWRWETATPYTDADRQTLVSQVLALHATLVAGDYDAFAALNVVRDTELARSLDVRLDTLIETDRMMLDPIMQEADWQVAPLYPTSLEVHQRAGGRLVEVTGPNKSAPIIASAACESIAFPLTFSNLKPLAPHAGGWMVTR